MIFNRLGVVNAFLTYFIFNLQWLSRDITPLYVKEGLYLVAFYSWIIFCLYGFIMLYLSIHPLIDIWTVSLLELL